MNAVAGENAGGSPSFSAKEGGGGYDAAQFTKCKQSSSTGIWFCVINYSSFIAFCKSGSNIKFSEPHLSSRFPPQPNMIKKGIEALIDREYLRRDNSDRHIYHYIA